MRYLIDSWKIQHTDANGTTRYFIVHTFHNGDNKQVQIKVVPLFGKCKLESHALYQDNVESTDSEYVKSCAHELAEKISLAMGKPILGVEV